MINKITTSFFPKSTEFIIKFTSFVNFLIYFREAKILFPEKVLNEIFVYSFDFL